MSAINLVERSLQLLLISVSLQRHSSCPYTVTITLPPQFCSNNISYLEVLYTPPYSARDPSKEIVPPFLYTPMSVVVNSTFRQRVPHPGLSICFFLTSTKFCRTSFALFFFFFFFFYGITGNRTHSPSVHPLPSDRPQFSFFPVINVYYIGNVSIVIPRAENQSDLFFFFYCGLVTKCDGNSLISIRSPEPGPLPFLTCFPTYFYNH